MIVAVVVPSSSTTELVTAYCQAGTTASGEQTHVGIVATREPIPFGTRITLKPAAFGRHTYVVEDRMASTDAASIDVFEPSCRRAIDFGIRSERVTGVSLRP
jgi:3D (Asp-Asp-Asp) domain-containing protein